VKIHKTKDANMALKRQMYKKKLGSTKNLSKIPPKFQSKQDSNGKLLQRYTKTFKILKLSSLS